MDRYEQHQLHQQQQQPTSSIDIEIYSNNTNNTSYIEEATTTSAAAVAIDSSSVPSVSQRIQVIESQQNGTAAFIPQPNPSSIQQSTSTSAMAIMPRASRRGGHQQAAAAGRQQKPYQIACNDPAILSVKPVKKPNLFEELVQQQTSNEVSLTVPVTSTTSCCGSGPNSIIDEDTPESESSQKSTKKLTLTLDNFDDSEESSAHATMTPMATTASISLNTATITAGPLSSTLTAASSNFSSSHQPQQEIVSEVAPVESNLRFSHLSIKYIDDNSVSAPLSPEQPYYQLQQQHVVSAHHDDDELKPYEPSDTDADSNLASSSAPTTVAQPSTSISLFFSFLW